MCLERLQLLARTSAICDLTFSLVCILESGFIPTPMIYLKILRVLRRWLLSVGDSARQIKTKETLQKMRTYQSFDHLYANVVRKSEGLLV